MILQSGGLVGGFAYVRDFANGVIWVLPLRVIWRRYRLLSRDAGNVAVYREVQAVVG